MADPSSHGHCERHSPGKGDGSELVGLPAPAPPTPEPPSPVASPPKKTRAKNPEKVKRVVKEKPRERKRVVSESSESEEPARCAFPSSRASPPGSSIKGEIPPDRGMREQASHDSFEDAPHDHIAHAKVRKKSLPDGSDAFWRVQIGSVVIQTTLKPCGGSEEHAARIARLLYLGLEEGMTKVEVEQYRATQYEKLRIPQLQSGQARFASYEQGKKQKRIAQVEGEGQPNLAETEKIKKHRVEGESAKEIPAAQPQPQLSEVFDDVAVSGMVPKAPAPAEGDLTMLEKIGAADDEDGEKADGELFSDLFLKDGEKADGETKPRGRGRPAGQAAAVVQPGKPRGRSRLAGQGKDAKAKEKSTLKEKAKPKIRGKFASKVRPKVIKRMKKGVLEARVASLEASMREMACSRQEVWVERGAVEQMAALKQSSDSVEAMRSQLQLLDGQVAALRKELLENKEAAASAYCRGSARRSNLEANLQGLSKEVKAKPSINQFLTLHKLVQHVQEDVSQVQVKAKATADTLNKSLEEFKVENANAHDAHVKALGAHKTEDTKALEDHANRTAEAHAAAMEEHKVAAAKLHADHLEAFKAHKDEANKTAEAHAQAEVATIRKSLLDVRNMSLTHESAIESVTDRLEEVLMSLKGKVDSSKVEQMCGSLSSLLTQVSDIGAAVKEKVCLTQLNSTTMAWQTQMTQIENSLQQKVDVDRMQQLSSIASGFDHQMQRLDGDIAALRKQLLEMKEASASSSEVLNTNLQGLSKEVKAKPSIDQLHHVVNGFMQQVQEETDRLKQQAKEETDRLKHLENSIANVQDDFTGFQQGLNEALARP